MNNAINKLDARWRRAPVARLVLSLVLLSLFFWSFGRLSAQLHTFHINTHHSAKLDCTKPVGFGNSYGGWTHCRPVNTSQWADTIVYSVGVGYNVQWDAGMIKRYATIHHGWDPTPTAARYFSKHARPPRFVFHRVGLGPVDDPHVIFRLPASEPTNYVSGPDLNLDMQPKKSVLAPVLSLRSMMKRVNHKWLSILKMDIEGAEFSVIDQWYRSALAPPADQVLIEFHYRFFLGTNKSGGMVESRIMKMAKLGFDLVIRKGHVRFLLYILQRL